MTENKFAYQMKDGSSQRNISDYVISTQDIPVQFTNKDLSITAKGFSFNVSELFPYIDNLVLDTEFRVFAETSTGQIFEGYVTSKTYKKALRAYEIKVVSIINKLKNFIVSRETLDTKLLSMPSYGDDAWYDSLRLSDVILAMFQLAEIDGGGIASSGYVVKNKEVKKSNPTSTIYRDFIFSNIQVDPFMLYGINQSIAAGEHTLANAEYSAGRITFFDFVSYIAERFNLLLQYNNGGYNFKWLGNTDADGLIDISYSLIPDDEYIHATEDTIQNKAKEWGSVVQSHNRLTYNNPAQGAVSLVEVSRQFSENETDVFEKENLEMLSGLVFLLHYDEPDQVVLNQVYKWEKSGDFKDNILLTTDGILGIYTKKFLIEVLNKKTTGTKARNAYDGSYFNNSPHSTNAITVDPVRDSSLIIENIF